MAAKQTLSAKNKEQKPEYFGPSIRALLIAIDRGIEYKSWLRGQLRKKGFVYKSYTKTRDRVKRREFAKQLIEEQKLITQFRKAIKVLRAEEKNTS